MTCDKGDEQGKSNASQGKIPRFECARAETRRNGATKGSERIVRCFELGC
jgi:hypothetical protein